MLASANACVLCFCVCAGSLTIAQQLTLDEAESVRGLLEGVLNKNVRCAYGRGCVAVAAAVFVRL